MLRMVGGCSPRVHLRGSWEQDKLFLKHKNRSQNVRAHSGCSCEKYLSLCENVFPVPLQSGKGLLHFPSSEHSAASSPISSKPGAQLKLQVEPGESSDDGRLHLGIRLLCPFGLGQIIATWGKQKTILSVNVTAENAQLGGFLTESILTFTAWHSFTHIGCCLSCVSQTDWSHQVVATGAAEIAGSCWGEPEIYVITADKAVVQLLRSRKWGNCKNSGATQSVSNSFGKKIVSETILQMNNSDIGAYQHKLAARRSTLQTHHTVS